MIFPFVWRILPGPVLVKLFVLLVLLAAIVAVCFTWVFPWLTDDVLPPPDGVVEGP